MSWTGPIGQAAKAQRSGTRCVITHKASLYGP